MITKHIYTFFFGFLFLLMVSCTPNSNTFYNRQWQPVSTKYNVLFNSEEAFAKGKKKLEEKYEDDFSKILSVEPVAITDETKLNGMGDPDFERAEEKAIKTIQKHSMVYKGRQRNYKIDDAYMMLGKARYFNQRFIPALEAFNHLLDSYGESNRLGDAAIWREKTNLRLGQDEIVLENLKNLIDTLKMKRATEVDARATLSQVYINLGRYNEAIVELEETAKLTKNKNYRGRYYFIAAQLNERLNKPEQAVDNYKKVVDLNWKIPRRLWIEAQGGIARNKEFTKEEREDFLSYMTRLEGRHEHKDFLDVLYYNHGKLLEKNNKNKEAINFYEESIKSNTKNTGLKKQTYRGLAELYFLNKEYLKAFNNFDEALKLTEENTLEHLYLKRKRDNLKQVASLEQTIKKTDRLLKLENMTKSQRQAFLTSEKDSLAKLEKEKNSSGNETSSSFALANTGSKSSFYFYNPATVAYGKQNFKRRWGNRILQDNWRTNHSSAIELATENESVKNDTLVHQKKESIASKEENLENSPTSKEGWDAIRSKRNDALYELGVLYESKFKDHELAVNRLKSLLESNPNPELSLLANYEMYKVTRSLGKDASMYGNFIASNYPNSDYALIVKGEIPMNSKGKALEDLYAKASEALKKESFSKVVDLVKSVDFGRGKSDLSAQILFVKAQALARLEGVESYQKELKLIQERYPKSEIAKEIDVVLTNLSSVLSDKAFSKTAKSWKVVIRNIPQENRLDILNQVKEKLSILSKSLSISEDIYNREETWLVIHHIANTDAAMSVIKEVERGTPENVQIFMISSENYRKVQLFKNVDKYLNE